MAAQIETEKTSPVAAIHEEADVDYCGEDDELSGASSCGCGCFRLPWRRNSYRLRQRSGGGGEEAWLGEKLKRVKEFSEVVAGPKWKNFIRKVGGYFSGNKRQKQRFQYQYDPESYALNFDSGGDREEDGLLGAGGYTSRFAAPVSQEKRHTPS